MQSRRPSANVVPDKLGRSHRAELERFLQACVGKDRDGRTVTVFSAFARLELDPRVEARNLAEMGRHAANKRLGLLLSEFHDVPDLGHDHRSIVRDLTLLLPELPSAKSVPVSGSKFSNAKLIWSVSTWVALATVLILVLLKLAGG